MTQPTTIESAMPVQFPSMFCHHCGGLCVVPDLGVIGGCPHCAAQCRFVGPCFSEPAPLITVAGKMPRFKH